MKNYLYILAALLLVNCGSEPKEAAYNPATDTLKYEQEVNFRNVRQLTFGENNAEAYWSFDDTKLIFQSDNAAWGAECDQIYYMEATPNSPDFEPKMISTGMGRTTCSFFLPGDTTFVYGSTHLADKACPEVPVRGPNGAYVWPIYEGYDIFKANLDGEIVDQLTDTPGYDAEATLSPDGTKIVFTKINPMG